ncbi:MAG: energy-coupling factor transporter transmembrane protein EcfT [Anaerolineae bacterium]|nr:energy-coupling factor transporter transmembrane protein EcfT [Anaerolineae bacterium]
MNEFERLQAMVQGQYLPTGSIIHRLDPRARLLGVVLLLVGVTAATSLWGALAGLALAVCLLLLARVPLRYALRSLLAPLPFLLIIAALQVLFSPPAGEDWFTWGMLRINQAGLLLAIRLLLRFAALILLISLSAASISSAELTRALQALLQPLARLGLPVMDGVLALQVSLHFLPFLGEMAARIAKAQAARGAEWGSGTGGPLNRARQALPLILPVFLNALRKAETLADGMLSRAYGSQPQRTALVQLRFTPTDALALLLATLSALSIILIRI